MSAKLRRSSSSESTAARSGTDAYLSPLPPPHRDAHAGSVDHGGQYEAHKPGPVVERPEQAGSGRAAQCGDEARQVGQDAGDERENRDPVEAAREFVDAVPLVEIVEHELTAPYDEVVRRGELVLNDLYKRHGIYEFSRGFNWIAILALVTGVLPNLPGFVAALRGTPATGLFGTLYNWAWFVGFILSAVIYIAGMRVSVWRRERGEVRVGA